MSGDGLLSLRWNNHRTSFLQVLSTLRNKQTYSDITIACSGRFYSVHKLVLSACSDYFVEMMEKTPCKHPVIVLKDIRHQELEALLNYMYLGEVNVLQNDLAGLIKAAECLRIKGLAVPDESPPPYSGSGGGGGGGGGQPPTKNWEGSSPQSKKRRIEEESTSDISSQPRKKSTVEDHPETMCERESPKIVPRPSVNEKPVANNQCEKDSSTSPAAVVNTAKDKQRLPSTPREETAVMDTTEIKLEEEEVKYEDEENLPGHDACSTLEVQMVEDDGSNQGPQQSNDTSGRLKINSVVGSGGSGGSAGPNLLSPSSQPFPHHPQSFEEIVSQALPGPSGMQGEGSQSWDGSHAEGDITSFHLRNFPQQEGMSSHHRNLQQLDSVEDTVPRVRGSICTEGGMAIGSYPLSHYGMDISQLGNNLMEADGRHPRQWRCFFPDCGYVTDRESWLRQHFRKHTGEKPFSCPYCSFRSAQKGNLNVHIKRVHFPEQFNADGPAIKTDFLNIS